MITKTLHNNALATINAYLHFSNGDISVNVPYYNNRRGQVRGGLRVLIGKGSPSDINDEITLFSLKEKVSLRNMPSSLLKEFMVNHNVGIDCSGLAYYILNAESLERKKGTLQNHLKFPYARTIIRRIISAIRPAENTGVTTFAHDTNSRKIELQSVEPGDFVTMLHDKENSKYDHIIVFHQIEYQNNIPTTLHYTHSMAWPTDGEYNHGVRQGVIQIIDPSKPLIDQVWVENNKLSGENFTQGRAVNALQTEIRRLRWFS